MDIESLPRHIASHISPVTETGCWLWDGSWDKDGYARTSIKKRTRLAHRVTYEWFIGPIPLGLTIDHLCKVKCCVNPVHLEAVSMRVNVLRSNNRAALGARQTHCKRGHSLADAYVFNDTTHKYGKRLCRECNRQTCAAKYLKSKTVRVNGNA